MTTEWHEVSVDAGGPREISGLPGVRVELLPVFNDPRGSLHELWRSDEIPSGFQPLMACSSWSLPGVQRGPHEHVEQDDYFSFAGPSDFDVALWDARPGAAGPQRGWLIRTGARKPSRIFIPRGVVHGYRNVGNVPGLVVTVASALFRGEGRTGPVDEIRHECQPGTPYRMPTS